MSGRRNDGGLKLGRLLRAVGKTLRQPFAARQKSGPIHQVQLALVIPLSDEIANAATQVQIEILRKLGHNPGLDAYPHITLKMGFNTTDIAPFEEYLESLANAVAPFEISISDFDYFDNGILFLNVVSNSDLENLRQRILADLSQRYGIQAETIEGPWFRFHVTLAYGFTDREFAELRKSFATRQAQYQFKAYHIDLFCHTGQQWVTYKRATLRD